VTWVVVAFSAHWLAGFSWEPSALLGAVLVVTGPTVIVPMLRTVRPTARIANILRWEGIVIDPVGALLAVLVFDFIVSAEGSSAFGQTIVAFFKLVGVGISIGLAGGFGLGEAMRRDWLPGYLDNMVTLAVVFAAFAMANVLAAESGLLAVTAMGIYLANRKGISLDTIIEFKESLSLLLISGLFIVLAARLDLAKLRPIAAGALAVLVVVQFVARPFKVWLSTFRSTLSWPERVVLGWIAPRGIVAAAVCALFALQLERLGFQQAELMVPVVFTLILGTLALPSLTARLLARSLKVAEPDADGFLIVGAGRVALAIAKALTEREQTIVMADQDWFNVQRARREGLRVYHGNPLSEHAETQLDLAGVGRLLALSADPHLNALACARFRSEFGARRVYAARAEEGSGSRATTMPATQIVIRRRRQPGDAR